jgi:hypothetical protein
MGDGRRSGQQTRAQPPQAAPAAAGAGSSPQQQRGQHASLKAQAGALYRKNAVYQRRNLCSNVCLLSAPIFFCIMLLAVQVAINRLLLTGEDYEVCGVGQRGAAAELTDSMVSSMCWC